MTVDYEPDAPPRPAPVAGGAPRSAARDTVAEAAAQPPAGGGACAPRRQRRRSRSRPRRCAPASRCRASRRSTSIAGRVTVPTTGEAKRVQIDEAQLDPALDRAHGAQARPEGLPLRQGDDGDAARRSCRGRSRCSATRTFVGNGRLPLLAPGEEHELGFGVDDSVRVRHAIAEEKRGETGIITSSKTDTRNYRITVKNLHARAIPVTVIDQIPVSQNADIKVELLGQDSAHQARPRRQARRAGLGDELCSPTRRRRSSSATASPGRRPRRSLYGN